MRLRLRGFARSFDIYDDHFGRVEHARQARIIGKAAADDEGRLPHLVKAAGVLGEPALIGGEEAVDQQGDANLPAVGVALSRSVSIGFQNPV